MLLNEILVPLDVDAAAAERADDTRGGGLPQAEWIADRDDEVADIEIVGVAELELAEVLCFYSQQRNVRRRIAADDLCIELTAVGERHDDRLRVLDDVAVRYDQSLLGVDDDPRADSLLRHGRLPELLRQLEESAEEGVLEKRVLRHLRRRRRHGDVDHCRCHALEHRRKGRIIVLVDERPCARNGVKSRDGDGEEPRPYGPAGRFHVVPLGLSSGSRGAEQDACHA